MPGYFYTIELDETFGPMLEKLAAHRSADDVEAFAANLLIVSIGHALSEMERDVREMEREAMGDEAVAQQTGDQGCDDDHIPF